MTDQAEKWSKRLRDVEKEIQLTNNRERKYKKKIERSSLSPFLLYWLKKLVLIARRFFLAFLFTCQRCFFAGMTLGQSTFLSFVLILSLSFSPSLFLSPSQSLNSYLFYFLLFLLSSELIHAISPDPTSRKEVSLSLCLSLNRSIYLFIYSPLRSFSCFFTHNKWKRREKGERRRNSKEGSSFKKEGGVQLPPFSSYRQRMATTEWGKTRKD